MLLIYSAKTAIDFLSMGSYTRKPWKLTETEENWFLSLTASQATTGEDGPTV